MDIRKFWGKADNSLFWHPALYHMIDSGMVAKVLLNTLPIKMTKVLTDVYTIDQLAYFVSLHDIGKITPGFNFKILEGRSAKSFGFLANLAADEGQCDASDCLLSKECCFCKNTNRKYSGMSKESKWHNFGTAKILRDFGQIRKILGAHHGTFLTNINDCNIGCDSWLMAQKQAIKDLQEIFIKDQTPVIKTFQNDFIMIFAAFVAIADWISSNQDYFKCVNTGKVQTHTIEEYAIISEKIASTAIDSLNWNFQPHAKKHDFINLFGVKPYSWQKKLITKLNSQKKPFLLLIEAPTGCGKSEAAMSAADIAEAKFGYHGTFFALPTQAASNQMYGRFGLFLKNRPYGNNYKPDFHLRHHLSFMDQEYREIKRKTVEGISSDVLATEWFTRSKQGLLSPYAVGTIDQAIMAGLMIKHNFVRMFGLLNKVVVFDEVHSYDVYSSNILYRIIEWLSYLGTSVVVLSATLPRQKRNELISSYCGKPIKTRVKYPLFAVANEDKVTFSHIDCQRYRSIRYKFIDEKDLIKRVQVQLSRNVNVAVVRNIIGEAQDTFRSLRDSSVDCSLFHARFPAYRRREIEELVVRKYSKDSKNRPNKSLLVATDVIGQSVDLDFDVMFTDIAPIDIMLQRLGRLWRHDRKRSIRVPTLYVIRKSRDYEFGKSEIIYSKFILDNTMKVLLDRFKTGQNTINKIDDVELLINGVYDGKIASLEDDPEYQKSYGKYLNRILGSKILAGEFRIPRCKIDSNDFMASFGDFFDVEEGELTFPTTRLKLPSIPIICVDWKDGSEISVDGQVINISKEPEFEEIKLLLTRSVNIMIQPWFKYFSDQAKINGWEDTILDRYRIAVFDQERYDNGERYKFLVNEDGAMLSLNNIFGLESRNV
jgi:CRISPR-associated endonuclease/helicase Cas3